MLVRVLPSINLTGVTIISYLQAILDRISRPLVRCNTVHSSVKKNTHLLWPVKDDLGLKVSGIYCNVCDCGKVMLDRLIT